MEEVVAIVVGGVRLVTVETLVVVVEVGVVERIVDTFTGVLIEADNVVSICAQPEINEAVIPKSPIKVNILDFRILKYDKLHYDFSCLLLFQLFLLL